MTSIVRMILALSVGLFLSALAGAAPASKLPTQADVESRIAELGQDSKVLEETKKSRSKGYETILENLSQAASAQRLTDGYATDIAADGRKIQELKTEIDKLASDSGKLSDIKDGMPLSVLEQKLSSAKSDRASAEALSATLVASYSAELARPDQIYKQLADNKKELQNLEQDIQRLPPANDADRQAELSLWLAQSRVYVLEQQNISLNQELLRSPTHLEMIKLSQEKASLVNERIAVRISQLEERLNKERLKDAEKMIATDSAVGAAVSDKSVILQKVAEENLELSKNLTDISEKNIQASQSEAEVRSKTRDLEASYQETRHKLEIAGMSQALGQLLRDQRISLPDSGRLQKQLKSTEDNLASISLGQIRLSEARRQLRDLAQATDELVKDQSADQKSQIAKDLMQLLSRKRELLDKAIESQGNYQQTLTALGFSLRRQLEVVNEFSAYLSEHLLWVRSTPAVSLSDLLALPGEFRYLFDFQSWLQALVDIWNIALKAPVFLIVLLPMLGLVFYRHKLFTAIRDTGDMVGRPLQDSFKCTVRAVLFSLLLALPLPLFFLALGLLIRVSLDASAFTREIGDAVRWILGNMFFLLVFRALCMKGGVFERHFFWRPNLLKMIRQEIFWMLVLFLPAMFFAAMAASALTNSWNGSLIKAFLIMAILVLGRFLAHMLDPVSGALRDFFSRYENNTLSRLRFIWKPLIYVGVMALLGAVLMGYLYAAAGFANYLIDTLVLVLALVFVYDLVERWLLMTQRKLAYQAAMERRVALQAKAIAAEGDEVPAKAEAEDSKANFVTLSEESRSLMRAMLVITAGIGLWMIWASALPALNVFDKVVLWYHEATVNGVAQQMPTTLEDILLAGLIAFATYVAARNLPSLIEIIILQRMDTSRGVSYTVRTVTGYVITAIGMLLTLNALGGSWSQVQWLVAALGVGIGFGLQEIVANFISGLIVLFERPVRVGDYVTIGDAEGTVTRIQIRATTIETLDNMELLVPNKEFITGRLLNWSLSDEITRLTIPVGIAYGSDVDMALSLMKKAAEDHPAVLRNYPIQTFFMNFGDNSLNLELRCFVGKLTDRMPTKTDLNISVNRVFAEHGLGIPFPQRDMHIHMAEPLDVVLCDTRKKDVPA